MDAWPDDVDCGFRAVYYGGGYERKIEAFAQRWNGLETENFSRALENGTPEEKALALFVLSYQDVPTNPATFVHRTGKRRADGAVGQRALPRRKKR